MKRRALILVVVLIGASLVVAQRGRYRRSDPTNIDRGGVPVWEIPKETFEATLAVYSRDQDAVDRGLQAG